MTKISLRYIRKLVNRFRDENRENTVLKLRGNKSFRKSKLFRKYNFGQYSPSFYNNPHIIIYCLTLESKMRGGVGGW